MEDREALYENWNPDLRSVTSAGGRSSIRYSTHSRLRRNDTDHRGRASDLSTCEDVVAASGASDCSELTGATFAESS
jgi:hypothetical protein